MKKNDIGLVVKSKDQIFWAQTIKETKAVIESYENKLKFEKAVLAMSLAKLKEADRRENAS